MSLHPAERAWRTFRKTEMLPYMEKLEASGPITPPRLLGGMKKHVKHEPTPDSVRSVMSQAATTMIVMSAYRDCKFVVEVDERLWSDLRRARWPAVFPTAHLILPRPCTILSAGGRNYACTQWAEGIFVAALDDQDVRAFASHSMPLPPWREIAQISSRFETLGEAWEAHEALYSRDEGQERDELGAILNSILYALGDHDVVMQTTGAKKIARSRAARDLTDPDRAVLGGEYARILDRHAAKTHVDGSAPQGGTKSPHLRSAHSHLYWTGPGRAIPRVRYLPPIPVHGGSAASGDDLPEEVRLK